MRAPFLHERANGGKLCYCKRCDKYKSCDEFYQSSIEYRHRLCKRCVIIKVTNDAKKRQMRPCTQALLNLRKRERRDGTKADELHLLEREDVQWLIYKVWGNRSAFEGNGYAFWRGELVYAPDHEKPRKHGNKEPKTGRRHDRLVLARWDTKQPFRPWNSILLTRKEARIHEQRANWFNPIPYPEEIVTWVDQVLKKVAVEYRAVSR